MMPASSFRVRMQATDGSRSDLHSSGRVHVAIPCSRKPQAHVGAPPRASETDARLQRGSQAVLYVAVTIALTARVSAG